MLLLNLFPGGSRISNDMVHLYLEWNYISISSFFPPYYKMTQGIHFNVNVMLLIKFISLLILFLMLLIAMTFCLLFAFVLIWTVD